MYVARTFRRFLSSFILQFTVALVFRFEAVIPRIKRPSSVDELRAHSSIKAKRMVLHLSESIFLILSFGACKTIVVDESARLRTKWEMGWGWGRVGWRVRVKVRASVEGI